MLISPGRNVKHSDMHLLDMVHMGQGNDGKVYIISGNWDPKDSAFGILNTETPKDTRVFMTVAVDLVIAGIREPVRFVIETKAKIFPQNERFWYINKKPLQEKFHLKLKEVESTDGDEAAYEVVSIISQTEKDRKKANLSLNISPTKNIPEDVKTPNGDESSDPDEPIMSGSGSVSKEITDEELLKAWGDTLKVWHQNLALRPKQVHQLCRKGIPEALRGEVWQLLAGCQDSKDMFEAFRILITKDSVSEDVIMRDINRTFPAHDYFRETGGLGQDALYKISKAYSVYDEEIGYCQGLSFLAAGLVLHMPEEQAFAVLVKIMFDYGLRDLFKNSFDDLHLKFYQLERLMQDQLSDLYEHFMELRLEAHMYASQWFLTLFTAKFPLFMVFHIMDVFLSEGMNTIFHVALALLKSNRKELLALDFEGILKYFRVQLPKKYRSEENARELLTTAVSWKISSKKLKKYEKEYMSIKEAQMQQEDPIERYERENKRLMEANMRLEQENDDLAHELVTSKIQLRSDLDASEDKADALAKELLSTKTDLVELEEEKKRLETESAQLKDMCRRELEKLDQESSRNNAIIAEYKQICTQLSERLEKQASASKIDLAKIKEVISGCDRCTKLANTDTQLKSMDTSMTISDGADPNQVLDATKQIRELELELAQTKLALVESECKTQDLTHQLNAALTELQASKNTWFQKTFNSIKEAAAKRDPKERDSKDHKEKERENKERKESMT
ncbi:rab GTPase-activating protein 1-like isoform X2 [Lingula anatina]|uniref:Rab GTPase-activating protein 1-like isoform X2 n=1 Tax=Lingula anatina TaxID=7574 RepID=A0A1S3JIA6_LINAN|nr:rab GTPase-activating protein 1-like isoform X2 [Lingula anatina]|eukprot:XP_013410122.1 rab GTPase-activating protein 1-like isoform X2 [Lingula anatina]